MSPSDPSGARSPASPPSDDAAADGRTGLPLQQIAGTQDRSQRPTDAAARTPITFYEAAGGQEVFERLGHRFYELVAADPVLRPLYPDEDLQAAEHRLVLFLSQYWGGPSTYSAERGHPRLRMRHRPFAIGPAERDAWLANMRRALDELDLDDTHDAVLWEYLVRAAFSLQNTD